MAAALISTVIPGPSADLNWPTVRHATPAKRGKFFTLDARAGRAARLYRQRSATGHHGLAGNKTVFFRVCLCTYDLKHATFQKVKVFVSLASAIFARNVPLKNPNLESLAVAAKCDFDIFWMI